MKKTRLTILSTLFIITLAVLVGLIVVNQKSSPGDPIPGYESCPPFCDSIENTSSNDLPPTQEDTLGYSSNYSDEDCGADTPPSIEIVKPINNQEILVGEKYYLSWKTCNIREVLVSMALGGHDLGHYGDEPFGIDARKQFIYLTAPDFSSFFGESSPEFYNYTIMVYEPENMTEDRVTLKIIPTTDEFESDIRERADNIIESLNASDVDSFISFVHPTKGFRYSQYGNVSNDDLLLTQSSIQRSIEDGEPLLWGYGDGSGLPIEHTFSEWFNNWSNGVDYSQAPNIAYRVSVRPGGGSINNIAKFYEESPFMSYHFPYTTTYTDENGDEVPQELSWTTLNLVFENYEDEWYLTGLITDGWTI